MAGIAIFVPRLPHAGSHLPCFADLLTHNLSSVQLPLILSPHCLQEEQSRNAEAAPSWHSAWELFDASTEAQQMLDSEQPRLDSETRDRLLEAVTACLGDQRYHLFVMAPEPDESFAASSGGNSSFVPNPAGAA